LIGKVDDQNRALVDVAVRRTQISQAVSLTVWIDTAFNGHLVFPRALIKELELESLAETEAILADGKKVILETFLCYLEWFGTLIPLQVIANEGRLPLLGTELLEKHVLHIDYANLELNLD
jgi:clan AA aspartic protease